MKKQTKDEHPEEFGPKSIKLLFDRIDLKPWTFPKVALCEKEIIQNIYVDEIARLVIVKFKDGHAEKVHCDKEDEFDVAVGAAIGICRHIFGSHTSFYKHVVQKKTIYTKRCNPTEYDTYIQWCKTHKERLVSENTFKKNKAKYLKKMKGEK